MPVTHRPTRVESLIESRLAEAAAEILAFAHAVTEPVFMSIMQEVFDHGGKGTCPVDVVALRSAIFSAVARYLIDEAERRLNPPDILSVPPDPDRAAKPKEARKQQASWMRKNRHRRRELIGE